MDISQLSYSEEAIMDDIGPAPTTESLCRPNKPDPRLKPTKSPRPLKTRSLSDGGNTPKLSPSPHIIEAALRTSKDDTSLHNVTPAPVTPLRNNFAARGLSLQTTQTRDFAVANRPVTTINSGAGGSSRSSFGGGDNCAGAGSRTPGTAAGVGARAGRGATSTSQAITTAININTSGAFTSTSAAPTTNLGRPSSSSTSSTTNTSGFLKPTTTPISPKVDHSQIYASPTNILPRRSRGLDFSRSATSLHHSTLADQASPDSSPTMGGRSAMNIPGRRDGFGGPEQSSSSLWSVMGSGSNANPSGHGIGATAGHHNGTSAHISSSLGSVNMIGSESSSSSDEDAFMDEDMDDGFVTTPQVAKMGTPTGPNQVPWMAGSAHNSPAASHSMNSPAFQRPQRRIKLPKKPLKSGTLGLGLSVAAAGMSSKSPPHAFMVKDLPHTRRESISWAANQLHISSGNDSDDNSTPNSRSAAASAGAVDADGLPVTPSRPNVIRRTVTRRQNLLPKTKGFARIKAELIEESAPIEADLRRESQVIRQVRESDMDLEPRLSATTTALSSPLLGTSDDASDMVGIPDDMMMTDTIVSSTFKQQAVKNSKGSKAFWDTFSECSSMGGATTTPPPNGNGNNSNNMILSRGSTAPFGEDVNMDSPITATKESAAFLMSQQGSSIPGTAGTGSQSDTQRSGTPQMPGAGGNGNGGGGPYPHLPGFMIPPTAAEITRRINTKRRRDDDLDPVSFKRRAVSPGMSVHNSPIMQSPLQRDVAPWGSRPGSNGGERSSAAPSETGSLDRSGPNGGAAGGQIGPGGRMKGRIGFQGMVDTNDGLMRMSIE